jgi:hypothetical protein
MVISTQGVLGKGTAAQIDSGELEDGMGLNFAGSSIATRLLYSNFSKKVYQKRPEVLDDILDAYAQNALHLCIEGFLYDDVDWHLCFLGILGDWPWHQKSGHLERTFNNVEKTGNDPKKPPGGVCHLCPAGKDGFPWEDRRLTAAFVACIGKCEDAWSVDGPLLPLFMFAPGTVNRGIVHKFDFWHCLHLGDLHVFVGSTLVEALYLFPGSSIVASLEHLDWQLDDFLKTVSYTSDRLTFHKLSQDRLSWKNTSYDYPSCSWSKATDAVIMLRFVIWVLSKHKSLLTGILETALDAARHIDLAVSSLYKLGIWIPPADGLRIATAGLRYLQLQQQLVLACFEEGRNRFLQMPKLHALFHIFLTYTSRLLLITTHTIL